MITIQHIHVHSLAERTATLVERWLDLAERSLDHLDGTIQRAVDEQVRELKLSNDSLAAILAADQQSPTTKE